MIITNVKLVNFRNYENAEIELSKNINLFFGKNGSGKTNILESIYVSSITKSYRTNKDIEVIKFNKDFTNIFVDYVDKRNNKKKTQIYISNINKKVVKEDEIAVKKLSNYIGNYNIVVFSPESLDIIKGSPKNRRKFIDILLSQLSKQYLIKLQEYNKLLLLKNATLRLEKSKIDINYLDVIDEKLTEYIKYIVNERKLIINKIQKYAEIIQKELTNDLEEIKIKYQTDFLDLNKEEILKLLKKQREQDIFKKSSSKGIQRDDILIYINDLEVNIYGSQGQNRTALLTLKLSELEIIKEEKEENPILLLDDVLSELDKSRIQYLLKYITNYQTVITTTEKEGLEELENVTFFKVSKGKVEKIKKEW